MPKEPFKLYTIGRQSRTLKQWREILGNSLPTDRVINLRMKDRNMTFIEAITYIKPQQIYEGEVYNNIEVLGNITRKEKSLVFCDVRCHCGKVFNTSAYKLKAKRTKSCGCLNKRGAKHNLSYHPLFNVWNNLNNRCNNPKDKSYKNYGAKGVTVCWEWHKDNPDGCQNFIDDMYPSYLKATKDGSKVQLDKDKLAIPGQPKTYSRLTCCWLSQADNVKLRDKTNITKLTDEQVKQIRLHRKNGMKFKDLTTMYDVNKSCISKIVNNISRKEV